MILCKVVLKFSREWCNMQDEFCMYFGKTLEIKFHPFCMPFITLGSFIFALYKWFEGDSFELYAIPDERGTKTIRHSYLERKWVLQKHQEYNYPNGFVSLHTCNQAPRIGRYRPDYIIYKDDLTTVKEVGLFQGTQKKIYTLFETRV